MGIIESNHHFENLNGVIDNRSPYQIQYIVNGPPKQNQGQVSSTLSQKGSGLSQFLSEKQKSLNQETLNFQCGGSVPPYSAKYYSFKDIETKYQFYVCAVKLGEKGQQYFVQLQHDLKIQSEKTISLRITPQLKIKHLNQAQIQVLKVKRDIQKQLICNSSVIINTELSHRLLEIIPEKTMKVSLLFKASENNFDTKRFYEKYGDVQKVLLICQTNKNKIIGSYSQNSIKCSKNVNFDQKGWVSIHDQSNGSFLFSLSCNDKFILKKGQAALFYNKNEEQICFGSDQLRINNHSDKNMCLTQNINTNYENHNYNNDVGSYQLLNGNKSPQFTTKEWEVWILQFQKSEIQEEEDIYLVHV